MADRKARQQARAAKAEELRLRKSLDELEAVKTPKPEFDSCLNGTVHRLRSKAIGDFDVEDLCIMIGQNHGLRWLVPLALDIVEENALASGDYYAGDLLMMLVKASPAFWRENYEHRLRLEGMVEALLETLGELGSAFADLQKAIDAGGA